MKQAILNALFASSFAEHLDPNVAPSLDYDSLATVVEAFTLLEPADWDGLPCDFETALWQVVEAVWHRPPVGAVTTDNALLEVRQVLVTLGLGPHLRPLEVSG